MLERQPHRIDGLFAHANQNHVANHDTGERVYTKNGQSQTVRWTANRNCNGLFSITYINVLEQTEYTLTHDATEPQAKRFIDAKKEKYPAYKSTGAAARRHVKSALDHRHRKYHA